MRAIARFLIRRHVWLTAVVLALTVVAAWRAIHLQFDLSFRTFFLPDPEDELARAFGERFPNQAGSFLVTILSGDDLLQLEMLKAIDAASVAAADVPGIERVYSLATVPLVTGDADGLSLEPAAKLADAVPASEIRRRVLDSPLLVRRLVSEDGGHTIIAALFDQAFRDPAARARSTEAVHAAIEAVLPAGVTVRHTGYPITEAEYARLIVRGFAAAQALAILLMATALYLSFRTISAVVLPLLTLGIAITLTLAALELSGQALTFTNASLPLLMLVIGVTENTFLISRYHEEVSKRGWYPEAAEVATADVLWPGFVAAATTIAGFFSLGTSQLALTRDFGFNMGLGGLIAYVITILVVPGVLARQRSLPARALAVVKGGVITRALDSIATAVAARPRNAIGAMLLLSAIGGVGLARVRVDQYATRELPESHPLMDIQRLADAHLGGTFQIVVGVHVRDGTLTSLERLRAIERLQAHLAAEPDVLKTWSIVDYLTAVDRALRGGDAHGLPETEAAIAQQILLLSMSDETADVDSLLDPSNQWATIVLGVTDLGTGRLRDLAERTREWSARELGSDLELRFAGDYWQVSRGNDVVARDQIVSMLAAFAMVLPLVALLLRSWKLTLLCIPPTVVPLLVATGVMGFADLPLRTGTSIVLPATIGVAIDTTTHFLARAREEWRVDRLYAAAVRRTIASVGRGMISSTAALVLGFVAYRVPAFQTFKDVGTISAATFAASLVTNLVLTPALVILIRPFGPEVAEKRRDRLDAGLPGRNVSHRES